ncbi:hypothetical protein OE88DRAFT_1640565 [Heliocybe sulcata]|uniref:Ion transport domain-containing protein n=1 Tax=Heliocybe sulcata TaxID=5364 RepID=A0A5C3NSH8_9AGAM|nr:hypothetical protein OE88DRAFT_1640565 [Heliocybe sulcata]
MPQEEYEPLDLESGETETEPLRAGSNGAQPAQPPGRSMYALSRQEIVTGIANRFVHSRTYIALYLVMVVLSITTAVIGSMQRSPPLSFYVLEIIINTSMICEVGVRVVALGKQFWRSPWNSFDLVITIFCAITLAILLFAHSGRGSKGEEVFDSVLLIGRNVLQFLRLAMIMRQSGQSIFTRPKAIDLSTARMAGYSMDIDMPDDEPFRRDRAVVFDAPDGFEDEPAAPHVPRPEDMPRAVQAAQDRDDEDIEGADSRSYVFYWADYRAATFLIPETRQVAKSSSQYPAFHFAFDNLSQNQRRVCGSLCPRSSKAGATSEENSDIIPFTDSEAIIWTVGAKSHGTWLSNRIFCVRVALDDPWSFTFTVPTRPANLRDGAGSIHMRISGGTGTFAPAPESHRPGTATKKFTEKIVPWRLPSPPRIYHIAGEFLSFYVISASYVVILEAGMGDSVPLQHSVISYSPKIPWCWGFESSAL